MDLNQSLQDRITEHQSAEDGRMKPKFGSELKHSTGSSSGGSSFDCNICFEPVHDPVVTLCGHLYCWPCIFKWLNVQNPSSEPVQGQACPVCKASISEASLVPLYCNSPLQTETETESEHRRPNHDVIPPRPTASALQTLVSRSDSRLQMPSNSFQSPAFHHQQYFSVPDSNFATLSSSNHVSTTVAGIINPTIGLLSELLNPRMLGITDTSIFTFPLPSSYAVIRPNNPRIRRQELQLDKSLNRVSVFMLCCLLLCLLLF